MPHRWILSGLLIALVAPTGAADIETPTPSGSASGPASGQLVGPDGLGPVPSPPIGPAWQVGIDRALHDVLELEVVACDDGFVALAFGSDGRRRPRALVWTSSNGVAWVRGGRLAPRGDPDEVDWSVFDLELVAGDLLAFGGEDRRLVVWRSSDCGASWRRLRDRPAFSLGRDALGLDALRAVTTDDTLLVVGRQGGEMRPPREWSWTMDRRGWRRVRGGGNAFDFGLVSEGHRFLASRFSDEATSMTDLVTSTDGRRWSPAGRLPEQTAVIPDPPRDRLLAQTEWVDEDSLSPEIRTSEDGVEWSLLARAAPIPHGSSGRLYESDGVLVWLVDIWDDTEVNAWSWMGVSEDGGETWTVSAGWPDMRLAGLQAVAADEDAIVVAVSGERFDRIRVWTLPRPAADA